MFVELDKQGHIVGTANWKFSDAAEQTERAIVRGYDGKLYFKGEEPSAPEPTAEEQVTRLEMQYTLPRPVRTALLLARARGEAVDVQLMARVDEIEALAEPLRKAGAEDGHE